MDQAIKEEFKYIREEFKKVNEGLGKVNVRIDKMSEFMMTHVALKQDLLEMREDVTTKDDLRQVKSDIFNKLDGFAVIVKKADEEKTVTEVRLGRLEVKAGIV